MKFGICYSPDISKIDHILSADADYLELNATIVSSMPDDDFKSLKSCHDAGLFKTYSCNGLCPGELRLTGDVDFTRVSEYAEKTFARLAELGVKMLVFGSGKAKQVPDGFPVGKAWEQLFEVGRIFADAAAKNDQTVVVEGLRRAEVNIVNTLEDINYYIENVNRDNFRMHVDFYHMYNNGEELSEIEKYKDLILHAHICGKNRGMPPDEDREFIGSCLGKLSEIGYGGNVSFEGVLADDMSKVKAMLDGFREIANR